MQGSERLSTEPQQQSTRTSLTHGLAEEGTRIEAVTITPLGIFAPVVESHAMLVVGVRLARLTPVPTRETHALE